MRFKLPSLILATTIIACGLTFMLYSGFFLPNVTERNNEVEDKLEQLVHFNLSGATLDEFVSLLRNQYGIRTVVIGDVSDVQLDDVSAVGIQLKNCIRLAINSQDLSFKIRNGRLEIFTKSPEEGFIIAATKMQNNNVIYVKPPKSLVLKHGSLWRLGDPQC